jgi:hypothetical protein
VEWHVAFHGSAPPQAAVAADDNNMKNEEEKFEVRLLLFWREANLSVNHSHVPGAEDRQTNRINFIPFVCPSYLVCLSQKTDRRILFFFTYLSGRRRHFEPEASGRVDDGHTNFVLFHLSSNRRSPFRAIIGHRKYIMTTMTVLQ